jgi:tRNA G18 (ribose-2'-O)-methylase SpoU
MNDPRLDVYRNLRRRPPGRGDHADNFIVEGRWLVERLIRSDYEIESVVVQRGADRGVLDQATTTFPVMELPAAEIRELVGFDFHRGWLAAAKRKPIVGVDQLQPDACSLALLQITDMENVGSMLRSAAAFGIRQVLLDDGSVDPYSRRAMRVSMGAALSMRFLRLADPAAELSRLGLRGFNTIAATLSTDSATIDEAAGAEKHVLVMGNEADGLAEEIQNVCRQRVRIPMPAVCGDSERDGKQIERGGEQAVDSLNVAVAAAILMYELTVPPSRGARR